MNELSQKQIIKQLTEEAIELLLSGAVADALVILREIKRHVDGMEG